MELQAAKNTILFVISMVLITGLISPELALFWMKKEERTRKNAAILYGAILITFFIVPMNYSVPPSVESPARTRTQTGQPIQVVASVTQKPSSPKSIAKASSPKKNVIAKHEQPNTFKDSPELQIKMIVMRNMNYQNSRNVENLRKLNVSKQNNDGYDVIVEFNPDNSLSDALLRAAIEVKMADIYYDLYKSDLNIKKVTIVAYLPGEDKYGNTKDVMSYITHLNESEAMKINWEANYYDIKGKILPRVWTTVHIHPQLRYE